jgi:hypothetical protein
VDRDDVGGEHAKYRRTLTFAHFVKHMSLGSLHFAANPMVPILK